MKFRNTIKLKVFALMWTILFLSLNVTPSWSKEAASGLKLLEEFEAVMVDIAERVKPAVVNISPVTPKMSGPAPQRPGQRPPEAPSSGSGVVVDKKGYIVTNNHVVGDTTEVEVRFSDKSRLQGKVVGKDPDTDLAVVKVTTSKDLPFVSLGDSTKVKVGQWVMAVGNPFGLDRTVTIGVISGLGRENVNLSRYEDFIQTDASINPGNSGGPLFNLKGEVIGINTAIINFAQGIGFAIPSNIVQQVMPQLIERGKVTRGWLGVGIQQLTADLAEKFTVDENTGVLVNEVFEGDPAARAGIHPGDIITKVDGKTVETPSTLAKIIAGFNPGYKAKVEILRDGKKQQLIVELGEKKEDATLASLPKEPETFLGLNVQNLTPELADRFRLKEDKGVLITKIEPNSPAEQDLREGDLIKEIDHEAVNTVEDFNRIAAKLKDNDDLLVRVVREGRAFYVVLKPKG
jgi:serine protease Do